MFSQKMTCFDTFYPFQILVQHSFEQKDFEPITILYGGNGSGKTTALNVIAETLKKALSAYIKNNIYSHEKEFIQD